MFYFRLQGTDGILSNVTVYPGTADQVWLQTVAQHQKKAAQLLSVPEKQQRDAGYFHTLREVLQQPATWLKTGGQMAAVAGGLAATVEGIESLVLTGSGSSEYAGECVLLPLQNDLACGAQVLGGGVLLTYGSKAIAPARPGLMVSLARSGDSPESAAALSLILRSEPAIRHMVITCNAQGRLATLYRGDPRVRVVVLAKETNDCSLVMTSSFTNMVLAARSLGMLATTDVYSDLIQTLSRIAEDLLLTQFDALSELGERAFARVLYLGSGTRLGSARESALKMVEMTAGRVWADCETYLGLRHGPLSAVHADSLVVCCLSCDPMLRAYECDLIRELNNKRLGMAKLIFGEKVPPDLAREGDVVIDCKGLSSVGDDQLPVLYVLLGQVLAFFRCLADGLQPDAPSRDGVINRVVQGFTVHPFIP